MNAAKFLLLFDLFRGLSITGGRPLVATRWSVGIAVVAFLLWSGLCAAAWALMTVGGDWLITLAGHGSAWSVQWAGFLADSAEFLRDAGHIVLMGLWGLVSVALVVLALFSYLLKGYFLN